MISKENVESLQWLENEFMSYFQCFDGVFGAMISFEAQSKDDNVYPQDDSLLQIIYSDVVIHFVFYRLSEKPRNYEASIS